VQRAATAEASQTALDTLRRSAEDERARRETQKAEFQALAAERQKLADESQRRIETLQAENRALEAERATLRAAVERGASEAAVHAQRIAQLEASAREAGAALERERARREAPPRAVEVLEAEVLPPERPAAAPRAAPPPEPEAPKRGRVEKVARGAKAAPSLSDLERQARLELERLGADAQAFFAKKK
ncbi:MAG: hypothetical protein LBW77_07045, partial [Verrucomicrobiota bacterium]|jgi:septal ring factor EnvC (AmiA/AmiB activator)|nr:hypothetical protein [Verrucomicrobiota bacterium]